MSFNTAKTNVPNFLASVPSALTGGMAKFGVSFWGRYTNRVTDYVHLFGSSENYGNDSNIFQVKFNSIGRYQFRVAMRDTDGSRYYSDAVSSNNPSASVWNHLWLIYDSTLSTQQLKIYLNGALDAYTTITKLGLPTWTVGTNFNLNLRGTATAADTTDFGEIAVYAGDALPTLTEMATYRNGGALPAGAILDYPMLGSPDATVSSLPELVGGYTLSGSGSGLLTSEIGGVSASLRVKAGSAVVLPSAEAVHFEFETYGGSTAFGIATKAAGLDPTCKVKRAGQGSWGGEYTLTDRIQKGNIVRWALPISVRPTSIGDTISVTFPEGLIAPSESQFSEASTIQPTNQFGVVRYPLPATPRAVVGDHFPTLNYYQPQCTVRNMGLLLGPWYVDTIVDSRGVPTSRTKTGSPGYYANGHTYASLYAWNGGSPTGEVYVLWRGAASINLQRIANGASATVLTNDTVTYGGNTWYRKGFQSDGKGYMIAITLDGNENTNLTDLMVVAKEHWDGFVADSVWTPQWLATNRSMGYLRAMDAMYAVNCNAWDVSHIVPLDRASLTKSFENAGTIASIEPTTDPDGYFISGTVLKITCTGPHGLHNGQRVKFRGSTATFTYGSTTVDLNTQTASIRTNVAGYGTNEVEVRLGAVGTVTNVAGGEIYASIPGLPNPHYIASAFNELYAAYSRCTRAWINPPHGATDELVTTYAQALDAELNAAIELWIEYSNEVWNSAFEGQWRYALGEGVLLGQSQSTANNWYYAHRSYQIYKLVRAACPTRTVRMVIAGQSVTPSVVAGRMAYFKAEYDADPSPPDATWADVGVVMSVANYHDFLDTTSSASGLVNQAGVPNFGSNAVAEMFDLGFRDFSGYPAIIATYGKELWAYEGGFSADTPSNMAALGRAVCASGLVPAIVEQIRENWRRVQAWGFSGVCSLPLRGSWYPESTGKNWACAYRFDQPPGLGDGSDGLYSNLAQLDQYRSDGVTGWSSFVAPRLYAAEEWAGLGAPTPPVESTNVMFPPRYWPDRYFTPRYWADGLDQPTPPPATPTGFRAPFPWVWGLAGFMPLGYEIEGVPSGSVSIRSLVSSDASMSPLVRCTVSARPLISATVKVGI